MRKNAKIYVAGHRGLLGAALAKALYGSGYTNLILRTRFELDLRERNRVMNFFSEERPDYVFLAAARVGNIADNIRHPVDFMQDNILIQENVIGAAFRSGVKKLIFFSSNCCYPRECIQPMKEEYLMTGPLEPTNEAYALAKIVGMKLCQSYNSQYGTQFNCAILASLYGPNDHFGTPRAHVIADMVQKFCKAKKAGLREVTFWGDGSPRREYLYVDDAADAAILLMKGHNDMTGNGYTNVGTGQDIYIGELARIIKEIVGYEGEINWDVSKPNGMPRKLLDSSRLHARGWRSRVGLREGLEKTYRWYLEQKL